MRVVRPVGGRAGESHRPKDDRAFRSDPYTYIRTRAAFGYLAVILDVWSRRIDTRLTIAALAHQQPPPGCIHHTDRGSRYGSAPYRAILAEWWGLRGSTSRRGNPYDNAQAETYIKTLKSEQVHLNNHETFDDGSLAAFPRSVLQ